MTSIAKPPHEVKRFFLGYPATVGFEIDIDSGLTWCFDCLHFHRYEGMSAADVQTACSKIPDGAQTLILFCGLAPLAIQRSALTGRLDREARQALDAMLYVLDALIDSEGIPS